MPANTTIEESAAATLKRLEEKDRGLKQMLKKAYAYAVFPSVGKASLVVGGSYGRGAVFERGKFIGHATISQFTVGVQIGGDTFSELLVFENKEALERLKKGKMAFAANASAVLVKAGASGTKNFTNGVAAYAYSRGGMLLEAVIGGQKFKFKAADEEEQGDRGEEEGEEQQQGGRNAKAGKGQSGKGRAEASGEDEGEEDQGGEEQDDQEGEEGDGEESGMFGRALGGVRSAMGGAAGGVKSAASKVSESVKAHPVAATVVGTAVVAGVALLVMRAAKAAGEQSEGDGEEDSEARGQSDEGEEEQDEGGEEENEEKGDTLNQLRRRRSRA
jgi:hypothetical protein